MVFSSAIFILLFLPLTLVLYFAPVVLPPFRKNIGWMNLVLIFTSLLFYCWGEGLYVFVMLGCITFNWAGSLLLGKWPLHRRTILILGVAGNLLFLSYFKYAGFIFANLIAPLPGGEALQPYLTGIHMPIGISFFTFQAMSYLIDVYRGDVKIERNWLRLCLFKSFFPQLIAGPIVRYRDVAGELADRSHSLSEASYGIRRFIAGFAQKVIIANTLGAVADKLFSLPDSELSAPLAWIAAAAYTFQIYFDFCGYSNMAIGIARIFGFHFLENFNYPYISQSITDFWRRWHISLSTWFRDYLYIPLGGNRRGALVTYRNLIVVFLLCGLWHGAEWHFIVWGLYHGFFLVLERIGLGRVIERLPRALRHSYALLVVMFGWVIFRADSLAAAATFSAKMAGLGSVAQPRLIREFITPEILVCTAIAVIFSAPIADYADRRWRLFTGRPNSDPPSSLSLFAYLCTFALSLSYLAAGSFNPFIYFRF